MQEDPVIVESELVIEPVEILVEEVVINEPEVAMDPVKKFQLNTRQWIYLILLLAVVGGIYIAQDYLVAATVNGSPISRQAVVSVLERQSGQIVLDALIREKLIKSELASNNIVADATAVDAVLAEIEAQVAAQGRTLSEALLAEGVTLEQLREQIELQKGTEQLLADRISVTEEEVTLYIEANKITPAKDQAPESLSAEISASLYQQKLSVAIEIWFTELMTTAEIKYRIDY